MFSLTGECRFWTTNADVKIKSTDFGSFRYVRTPPREPPTSSFYIPFSSPFCRFHDKKETVAPVDGSSDEVTSSSKIYPDAKRDYSERRGHKVVLDNKRPQKLKDAIKKLEDHLREHPIVHSQWRDNAVLRLMLANGLLVHICLNVLTGAIGRISYDKYFVGKITTDTITDVLITKQHIVIAYNQNQITFVYLQKPSSTASRQHQARGGVIVPEKISRMVRIVE